MTIIWIWLRLVWRLYSLGPVKTLDLGFGSPSSWKFNEFLRKMFPRSSLWGLYCHQENLLAWRSCSLVNIFVSCILLVGFKSEIFKEDLPFISAVLVRVSVGNISSLPHQVFQILHGAEWQPKKSSVFRTTSTSPAQRSKGNLVYHHLQIWGWVTREFWTSQRYQVNASQACIRPGHPARRFPRSGSKGRVGPSGSQKGS